METRIKERLTGALILVAALVILVPEIFSGHTVAKPTRDAPPAAPATEGPPLRTYTTDVDATNPPPVASAAADVAPAPAAAPTAEDTPAEVPPAPPPAPAVASTPERPAPAPRVTATSPPPTRAMTPAPQPARPAPAPAAKPAASEDAAVARGQWYVQVGSFSQAANAERYAKQLRDQGFASVVLPPSGAKRLVRVRVGPTRNRDAAAALLERLKAQGHQGAVVGS